MLPSTPLILVSACILIMERKHDLDLKMGVDLKALISSPSFIASINNRPFFKINIFNIVISQFFNITGNNSFRKETLTNTPLILKISLFS